MLVKKLQLDHLHVDSFDLGSTGVRPLLAPETDPVSDPGTYEDTCIMCPTDDTCTRLGCTKTY
ncbi:hypothetical protein [Longimicrobium sp.]|uniref:hypothetical protein n=1 Tax=Longimicrobium sp. TaxID=2029185 RepID=UPI002CD6E013|nr:hypothetical protein [Longimicrobium sp.]HSU14498.1 hypothetical protein [Longimicrobium sp.]